MDFCTSTDSTDPVQHSWASLVVRSTAEDKVEGTEVGTLAAGSMVKEGSTAVTDISSAASSTAGKDIYVADSMPVAGSRDHPDCPCSISEARSTTTDLMGSKRVGNSKAANTSADSRVEDTLMVADSTEEDTLVDDTEDILVDNTGAVDNSLDQSHNMRRMTWADDCNQCCTM